MKSLFVCVRDTHLITHDGYIQLGYLNHSLEEHRRLNPHVNWIETYWCPDPFIIRYKRVNFQKTEKCNEGSPKTDNQGMSTLECGQAQSRLDRTV